MDIIPQTLCLVSMCYCILLNMHSSFRNSRKKRHINIFILLKTIFLFMGSIFTFLFFYNFSIYTIFFWISLSIYTNWQNYVKISFIYLKSSFRNIFFIKGNNEKCETIMNYFVSKEIAFALNCFDFKYIFGVIVEILTRNVIGTLK